MDYILFQICTNVIIERSMIKRVINYLLLTIAQLETLELRIVSNNYYFNKQYLMLICSFSD